MDGLSTQYTLSSKIRETPYAELHRGYRNTNGAPVVVKMLRSRNPSPLEIARLRHEHEVLASLSEPQIVKTWGLEKHGHGLALVLDDAGEISLDQVIRSGHLNLQRCLELAIGLARTLAVVHRHRIVHKDIKPQHFFVQKDAPDGVVLVDFGIATRLTQEVQSVSQVGGLEGTLAYIAPEQTGRMNRVVDCRSDLYSFGVTLYELFTGHLPFETTDPLELVHSHIARPPPPPEVHRADLPPVVSKIIQKLLAKAAEERYQSAAGLEHDLRRCLTQLTSTGVIESFRLGENDCSGELNISQKLYGRERELAGLLTAVERTRLGSNELILLSGAAGVGKSALVYELQQEVSRIGYFASGKFDFLGGSVPYTCIAHAFRELVRSVLAEPPAVVAQRRQSLLDAVGANGQILIDLVPELELVIGPQPSVPVLGPSESQHRFELVFVSFLHAFAASGHPLVLFLDDLQWADPGSLRLLQHVLTASGLGHLLIIGAYRKNEVSAAHPLSLMLEDLERAGTPVEELTVQPLELPHIVQLLSDTLGSSSTCVSEFANVLLTKTRGNPFFLNQFLNTLQRDGLLFYSHDQRAWRWDLDQISGRLATDNVVDFMLSRLLELPQDTQDMLRFAACIGHQFDGRTLATVSRYSADQVKTRLWNAVRQGLLIPLDGNYRYLNEVDADAADEAGLALNACYRFLHDRVQQAAYSLITDEERAAVHLSIGRLLLGRASDEPSDSELFEITDQLNRGRSCISESSEQQRLARLNVAAARKARNTAAPGSALHYLAAALDLLGEEPFSAHYELAWQAHLLKVECEYLVGNLEESRRLIAFAERHARSVLERVAVRNLELVVLYKTGQLPAACRNMADTVRLLGGKLPDIEDKAALGAAIGAAFGTYQASLAGRSVESLGELPEMTDPVQLALLETIANGIPAAFGSNSELHVLLVIHGVQALSRATANLAPFLYEQYAIVHSVITGDLDAAYRFGQLGIELSKQGRDARTSGQVYFLFGGFTAHWRKHISQGLELLRSALRLSLECGDRFYAAFSASVATNYRLYAGENLEAVDAAAKVAREVAEQTGDVVNQSFCVVCQQAVHALVGKTNHLGSLNSEGFDEASFESSAAVSALPFYGTVKAMLRYLAGKPGEALQAADQWPLPPCMFFHGEHALYRALAAAELARTETSEKRGELVHRLRSEIATIEGWARAAPENHAHRFALVRAELQAIEGNQAEAIDLYDQAIHLAHKHGFQNQEALANELAGRFHLAHGRRRVAGAYLLEAIHAYRRWGALAKVREVLSCHAALLEESGGALLGDAALLSPMQESGTSSSVRSRETESATRHSHGRLDLATAIRATEAIATELVVERLWERLMRTLLENAGAQRGCLILQRAGALQIEATISMDPNQVRLELRENLEDAREAPPTLVQYVARTTQPVVLADATRDSRFAHDPYITRVRPKSVLCIAMLQRGQLAGVLYLENNIATNAFSPARTELLQLLATQAAVAFENAKLYGELNAASDELRRANERLESDVAERTAELRRALADLWSEMDLARKIQTVLLPKETRLANYVVAATMLPADSVGGDYYDIIEGVGRDWIVIGDVSGHGVTAGLIMMMIQTAVRAVVLTTPSEEKLSPASALTRVNRAVRDNLKRLGTDQYMTIMALELERGKVRYSGLHQDIMVHRAATNTLDVVESRGMWLGIADDISQLLHDDSIELEPGDTVLLFTDGITESIVDGQMWDPAGLAQRFHALATQGLDPAAIVKGILGPFAGRPAADDMSVVVARYLPRS